MPFRGLARADIVMKSRAHHDSKYRAGVPVIDLTSSVPLSRCREPAGR